jgi:hypothetical protein
LTIREWCFPARVRRVPWARPVSLGLRALHLAAIALLLGGHAFGAPAEALFPWLIVAAISGAGLAGCDLAAWGLYWFVLGKGVSVLAKLALLLVIPFAWGARVPILAAVLLMAAVTSHMPARMRNYSLAHRRVLEPGGPLPRFDRSAPPAPAA